MSETLIEIRCINCNKLLGKVPDDETFKIELKCQKCKTIHMYKIEAREAQGK